MSWAAISPANNEPHRLKPILHLLLKSILTRLNLEAIIMDTVRVAYRHDERYVKEQ